MFIECLLALQLYRKWCHLKSWIVGLLSIPSFPLPPHFIIKICHFLFWHSHFRSSELWHFSEGVKSQSLCLPLKPNMQMHLPSVCEGTVSNLSTSLVESRMEGGDGRRTPLLLSTLTQDLSPSPAQLFLSPKSKQCLTRERRGEKYWNPVVISPARRLREVKIFPLDLFCLQDFHFMQSTLPADPWFSRLPGKIWKAKKEMLLLLGLQFSSLHSCSAREFIPLQRENWLHHSVLYITLAFNSWLHHAVTTLVKKDL